MSGIRAAKVDKIDVLTRKDDGSLVKETKAAIMTSGSNLYHAMLHSGIDSTRAISNSVDETFHMFGIDAAVAKIISETADFMSATTPSFAHLTVYGDELGFTGKITSIERKGLKIREKNPLLHMAYGAPIQIAVEAAMNNTKADVYGIAAPQMLGSTPKIGTIYSDLVIDEEYVAKNRVDINDVLDEL
jgi:DNA-directed RNA polymerase beta' subunit